MDQVSFAAEGETRSEACGVVWEGELESGDTVVDSQAGQVKHRAKGIRRGQEGASEETQ